MKQLDMASFKIASAKTKKNKRHLTWLLMSIGLLLLGSITMYGQTLEWAKHLPGVDNGVAVEIDMDPHGNVYIAGYFQDTTDFDPGSNTAVLDPLGFRDMFLAKYDADGNYIWAKRIMTSTSINIGLAVDTAGDAYVTGSFDGTSYFDTGSGMDSLTTPGSHANVFLTKYDSDGDFVWVIGMPSLGPGGAEGCAVDRSGNVYITGRLSDSVDFNPAGAGGSLISLSTHPVNNSNLFLAKYDPDGNYIWAKGALGVGYAQGLAIAVDTTGAEDKLCLTGFSVDTIDFDPGPNVSNLLATYEPNTFIAKYDTSGTYLWAKGMHTFSNRSTGLDIVVDTNANIIITGWLTGMADFDPGPDTSILTPVGTPVNPFFPVANIYLAKYDAEGNYTWAFNMEGGATSRGLSVAVDQIGSVYLTGMLGGGTVDFDPGPGTAPLTDLSSSPAGGNIFVAKYGSCGTYRSAVSMEGDTNVLCVGYGNGMVLTADGDAYITGEFKGDTDFDPTTGTSLLLSDENNIYLTKLHFTLDSIPTSLVTEVTCSDSFIFNGATYTASGIYQQWVPGVSQCDSVVVLDLTLSQVIEPVITVNGFILGVTNTYVTYQWIKNGVSMPGEINSTLHVTENADYQVAVTNVEGCADTSQIYVVNNVGITDINGLGKQIRIYPNPTSEVLNIVSPVAVHALLRSIEGRILLKRNQVRSISLRDLADGVYLLEITDKDGRTVKYEKVVKRSR